MVTITINENAIKVSDAQAYAIGIILGDYVHEHRLANSDNETLEQIIDTINQETIALTHVDRCSIIKAVSFRDENGNIDHFAKVDNALL